MQYALGMQQEEFHINTIDEVEENFHQFGLRMGSYGAQQAQFTAGGKKKQLLFFTLIMQKQKDIEIIVAMRPIYLM